MDIQTRLRPPTPPRPDAPLSVPAFLRAIRTNALTMWPQDAYEKPSLVRNFLGRRNVLLNAPDSIHHVMVANPGNYKRTPASIRILRPITGEGLLLSEGDTWKLQRRTVAPSLAPRVMPMLAEHIVRTTEATLDQIAVNTPINLLAAMQTLTLDIAGRTMVSLDMQQHRDTLRALMTEFGERFAQPHLLDLLLPPGIPNLRDLARARFSKRWMGFIETIIAARLRTPAPDSPRDLFDLLRAARDPETLRDLVATLILAGHETTAVTLFWALIILSQLPEEQDRVAAEAGTATLEPECAHTAMGALVRTKAIVNETLRLFPAAFTMARQTISSDKAGDVDLPAGSLLLISPWVLHRHHSLWDDPEAFNPDRFMPDVPTPPRFAFMPFGAGPRICVGAQFALTEAILVLAEVLRRFRVERVGTRPVMPTAIVTTQPDHPALVRFTAR